MVAFESVAAYGQLFDLVEIPFSGMRQADMLEAMLSLWNATKIDIFSICHVY